MPTREELLQRVGITTHQQGLIAQFVPFKHGNEPPRNAWRWLMAGFLTVVTVLGVLVILGATGAAPFLYTLF
jgi:hypothetical protein